MLNISAHENGSKEGVLKRLNDDAVHHIAPMADFRVY